MNRFEEIQRRISLGHRDRQIARALGCCRKTVRKIREDRYAGTQSKTLWAPTWSEQIPWAEIIQEVRMGTPIKFLWQEHAKISVSYGNFLKHFYKKYPEFREGLITLREFDPGSMCEVDYAGDTICWFNLRSKTTCQASVFIGVLGFSQLVFAVAREDTKSPRFLECHNEMYEFFGGVPSVTVCDCLKQGVLRPHVYDPDLNLSYQDLAKYYGTAIVPARVRKPKDKALVELHVKLVLRLFRWKFRNRTFYSISEINGALREICDLTNNRPHSRFKVSRIQRWEQIEKPKLKALPPAPYEVAVWKGAKIHPDCHIGAEGNFYSAPHSLRGRVLQVKITRNLVEIFHEMNRVAMHPRHKSRDGKHITDSSHLPANSRAYREATPQFILSQARFVHPALYELIDELFNENALGHLRRSQGLIREAKKELQELGHQKGRQNLEQAIEQMRRFNKIRVRYFRDLLDQSRKQSFRQDSLHQAPKRMPGNPMLRYEKRKEDQLSDRQMNLIPFPSKPETDHSGLSQ